MKYHAQALLAAFLLAAPLPAYAQGSPDKPIAWIKEKGEHFIVCTQHETNFVRTIMHEAERYYDNIADRLNFPRHSEFWLWDDRVTICLYDDKETYLAETGEPEWSLGMADYAARTIYSYIDSPRFATSVLPHEITHLIFRDFYKKEDELAEPPAWLDEGVAQWSEDKETHDQIRELAAGTFKKEGLLTVSDIILLNLDYVRKTGDKIFFRLTRSTNNKYSVIIMSPDILINAFYIASGSLVGYLIETFGAQRFAAFCRELSRGKAVSNALRAVYPRQLLSLNDLENGWRDYLLKK